MATENTCLEMTVEAGEDLSGSQYKAVALDDGKVANNGGEAIGILINKPESGRQASVAFFGLTKAYAGEALTKGDAITVATSGWINAATSGDYICGRAAEAVTSGSVGKILFGINPEYAQTSKQAW